MIFFVKLGFEIAVNPQTRTGDRTFEGVPDPNRQTVPAGQPRDICETDFAQNNRTQ